MNTIYQAAILVIAIAVNATADPNKEEKPARKIIISPENAGIHQWEIKYSSHKAKNGNVIHFFDCILTLKSKPIKPYWDELIAENIIKKDNKIVSKYEPRIWVNARPSPKGTSNYSIKCVVGGNYHLGSTIEVWIDRPTVKHTVFIIELGKFAK